MFANISPTISITGTVPNHCLHHLLATCLLQLAGIFGAPLEELLQDSPRALEVLEAVAADPMTHTYADSSVEMLVNVKPFQLRKRALHVYGEASRVEAFKAVCMDAVLNAKAKMQQLGALMDASHASCAELYECSSPELQELVALAKQSGALGARLTGESNRTGTAALETPS